MRQTPGASMRLQTKSHQLATKKSSIEEQRTVGDPAVKPRLASWDQSKRLGPVQKWLEDFIEVRPQAFKRSDEAKNQKEKYRRQRMVGK